MKGPFGQFVEQAEETLSEMHRYVYPNIAGSGVKRAIVINPARFRRIYRDSSDISVERSLLTGPHFSTYRDVPIEQDYKIDESDLIIRIEFTAARLKEEC